MSEMKEHFFELGWRDSVESLDGNMNTCVMTEEQRQWYADGWNAAREQEKQKGILFLLDELLSRMQPADEGYQIVKKIQKAYEAEKQPPLQGRAGGEV